MSFTKRVQEADEPKKVGPTMCCVFGCEMLGTISPNTHEGGPWYCRHHFGKESDEWPEITRKIRLGVLGEVKPPPRMNSERTPEQARELVYSWLRSRRVSLAPPSKEWAQVLKVREEAGEKLLSVQREAWRAALGEGLSPPVSDDAELIEERAAIQAEAP